MCVYIIIYMYMYRYNMCMYIYILYIYIYILCIYLHHVCVGGYLTLADCHNISAPPPNSCHCPQAQSGSDEG